MGGDGDLAPAVAWAAAVDAVTASPRSVAAPGLAADTTEPDAPAPPSAQVATPNAERAAPVMEVLFRQGVCRPCQWQRR